MSRRQVFALLIIALLVVVLIFNRGTVDVNMLFTKIRGLKSLVFLGFISLGVIIGALLR